MNFTLSTILIIFFLIPGFIFRRAYYNSPFPRKYSKFSLFGEISWIIIPSVILQIFGIYFLYWFWYVEFLELRNLYNFILDSYRNNPVLADNINYHVIVSYTAILWCISFAVGYLINLVIRRTHLDKRVKLFSFDNEWYYYLSGEILDFPHVEGNSEEVGLTFVDVLTKTGEETVLYSGVCQKFDLKEDGGLASICLTNVHRKGFANSKTSEIVDDSPTKEYFQYKEFPSTFLVIPFDNIINLNVRFFKVNIRPYVPPPAYVSTDEKTINQAEAAPSAEKKLNYSLSTGEALILMFTFLMILVALISIFSKPEKTEQESEEDKIASGVSLLMLIALFVLRFAFDFSWLASFLWSFAGAVVLAIIIGFWLSSSDPKKKK